MIWSGLHSVILFALQRLELGLRFKTPKTHKPHTRSCQAGRRTDVWQHTAKDKTEPIILQQKLFFPLLSEPKSFFSYFTSYRVHAAENNHEDVCQLYFLLQMIVILILNPSIIGYFGLHINDSVVGGTVGSG